MFGLSAATGPGDRPNARRVCQTVDRTDLAHEALSAAPLPRRNTVLRPSPSPRELALAPASHNKTKEFSKSALGIRRYRRLRKQKGGVRWTQFDACHSRSSPHF